MTGVLNLSSVQNYKELPHTVQLLFLIFDCCPPDNKLKIGKKEFANYINVDESTVARYLGKYVASNLIKYKYSGQIFVNPDIYFTGDDNKRELIRTEYRNFKSNM